MKIVGSASSRELIELAREHAREEYGKQLVQIICQHPSITGRSLVALDRIFPWSLELANAIATSGKAPISLLRRYAARRDRYLREHAELALLNRRLKGAGVREFREVLEQSRGPDPSAMARRSIVVFHPSTPKEILADLLLDPVDSLSKEAARRLDALTTRGSRRRAKKT